MFSFWTSSGIENKFIASENASFRQSIEVYNISMLYVCGTSSEVYNHKVKQIIHTDSLMCKWLLQLKVHMTQMKWLVKCLAFGMKTERQYWQRISKLDIFSGANKKSWENQSSDILL